MKVEIKEIEPCRKELSIRVPAEVMIKELDRVYEELRRSRRVPGFRPGKASRAVLRVRFGNEARSQALQSQVSRGYRESIRENNLKALGDPDFKEVEWDGEGDLSMKVAVDIVPEVEPKGYQAISLEKKKVQVDENEVESALQNLRERAASFEVVEDRELREGDWAQMDYRNLKSPDSSWMENALLEVKKAERDKFSSRLAGLKPGQTRVVEVELEPGKEEKSRFEVRLKEIKKRVLPELNDDLAQSWGNFKDMTGVREKIRQDLEREKEAEAKKDLEHQVTEYLIGKNNFSLPPKVVERLTKDYQGEMKRLVPAGGKDDSDQDYQKPAREMAAKELRLAFLLDAIAAREKIEVDPRTLGEEVGRLAVRQKVDPAELRNQLRQSGKLDLLEDRLRRRQTMDFLITNAKIKLN